jgi:tetratricopeptide (TPR) repeat protein
MKRDINVYYIAFVVSLLTFSVYLPSLQNDFVDWDDNIYVYLNPYIQSLDTSFLIWAFSDLLYGNNWHPLTWISHALDYAIWGLNPAGHHLTNNILHSFNTFLVVLLVMRLIVAPRKNANNKLSSPSADRSVLMAAGVTGLLFGLHPLHVESVAWVSERKDLLCAFFFLLTLISYEKYIITEQARRNLASRFYNKRYLLTVLLFLLALLSKPMAVSLPVVLLILDWYPFNRIRSLRTLWASSVEKIPFITLAFFSSVMTILAQKTAIAMKEVLDMSTRIIVAAQSLVLYLWKMIMPYKLIPLYIYPREVSLLSFQYFFPPLIIAGITIASLILAKKNKLLLAVWAYYIVTLIPVIGIVQVGNQSMADRYTYLPSIGPFLILGLLAAWITMMADKHRRSGTIFRFIGASGAVLLLVVISHLTVKQIRVWENTLVLFSHDIEASPDEHYLAYFIRGKAFKGEGQFDRAIKDFNKTIDLNPYYHQSYHNRASVFAKIGQLDKAIDDYTVSINARPTPDAYYERGVVFSKQGETDKAIEDFRKVVNMNPRDYEAYTRLGILYGKVGSFSRAIESFDKAIEINPDYHFTYGNRGHAYSLLGDNEKALENFNKAVALDNRYTRAYVNRGNLYLATGRKELALKDFQKACDLGDEESCSAFHGEERPAIDGN